jgi:predicted CoA-binding protein
MDSDSHSDSQIEEFYQLKNIAVVGVSKNEKKWTHILGAIYGIPQMTKYLTLFL